MTNVFVWTFGDLVSVFLLVVVFIGALCTAIGDELDKKRRGKK